jgi:hypothetical protein
MVAAVDLMNFHEPLFDPIVHECLFKVGLFGCALQLGGCHFLAGLIVPILVFDEFGDDVAGVFIDLFDGVCADVKPFGELLIGPMVAAGMLL